MVIRGAETPIPSGGLWCHPTLTVSKMSDGRETGLDTIPSRDVTVVPH